MQTPKARIVSLEVPQRTSPTTSRNARQLKMNASESDSASSHPAGRMPKDKSPKVIERRSPRSLASEKKRTTKISEMESTLAQLQEDVKKSKDQLASSESWKRRAQQEAEETKKQLIAMSAKFEESQRQLLELSTSEDSRLQELRKISQDRDRVWQSELESVQKQHSVDSAALVSAMNEIQRLKAQLERVAESENSELQSLKLELVETLSFAENLKTQLRDSKESEGQAKALVNETLQQLEIAKRTVDTVRSDSIKAMGAYSPLISELEQSRLRVNSLEELVGKLRADLFNAGKNRSVDSSYDVIVQNKIGENGEIEELNELKVDLDSMKLEVGQLRSALQTAESQYRDEHIRHTVLLEQTKSESTLKESKLEAALKKAKAVVEELKANLMDKETELQSITEENEGLCRKIENLSMQRESELEMELQKSKVKIADLKENLVDKETELQTISEENEMLKLEIKDREIEKAKVNEAVAEAEAARAAEREALMRLDYVSEEADKSTKRAIWVSEQLEAAQATNSKMESELRRLKVQSDQWRKAAEAATAVLTAEDNGKFMERSGSVDSNYYPITGKIGSPFSDDMDDESPKKRNNNMLKKIGVLWKKGQK